jgi:hypothetical protein
MIKELKIKIVLQQVKQGVFELLNAVCMHPVKWTQLYAAVCMHPVKWTQLYAAVCSYNIHIH